SFGRVSFNVVAWAAPPSHLHQGSPPTIACPSPGKTPLNTKACPAPGLTRLLTGLFSAVAAAALLGACGSRPLSQYPAQQPALPADIRVPAGHQAVLEARAS